MSRLASVYAQALYALAKEEGLEERILEQLTVLQESFRQEPEFVKLLSAHELPKQERCGILDGSFRGKVEPYVLNFMKILTEKGYMRHFSQCCDSFRREFNADHGILVVWAACAVALSVQQRQKLTDKLEMLTGKRIDLQCSVEPQLLGGVRLDYDGKRVDGTVRSRLDAIGSLLQNTVLG